MINEVGFKQNAGSECKMLIPQTTLKKQEIGDALWRCLGPSN